MAYVDINAVAEAKAGYKTHWGIAQYLFTAQGTSLDHNRKADSADATGFGMKDKNNIPTQRDGDVKISALAAMSRGKILKILDDMFGVDDGFPFWYCTEGLNAGAAMMMQLASVMELSPKIKLKDCVQFDASLSIRGRSGLGNIIVSPKVPLTGASGNGPVDDNLEATTFGGFYQFHLWALEGGTSPTVTLKVQQSDDEGETWTDLGSSVVFTGKGAQSVVIPSTDSIAAQTRVAWTATGTPSGFQLLAGGYRGVDPDPAG